MKNNCTERGERMITLPCPFCGEDDEPELQGTSDYYTCQCSWCGAQAQGGYTEKEALRSWNTRPKPKDTDAYNQGFIDAKNRMLEVLEILK